MVMTMMTLHPHLKLVRMPTSHAHDDGQGDDANDDDGDGDDGDDDDDDDDDGCDHGFERQAKVSNLCSSMDP